jgi:hypothetical protein
MTSYGPSVRVDDDSWHHVAAVFDREKGVTVLVDQAATETAGTVSGSVSNAAPLRIGDVAGLAPFAGDLDEVAVYSFAATLQDLRSHFDVAVGTHSFVDEIVMEDPVGYWRLGESGAATVAIDSTGQGHDGVYRAVQPGQSGALDGDMDLATGFPATAEDQDVLVSDHDDLDFGTGDFTVEAWVRTAINGDETIVAKSAGSDPGWSIVVTDDPGFEGRVRATLSDGSTSMTSYGPSVRVDDDSWHHVAAVFDREGGFRLYVDAIEQASFGIPSGDVTNGADLRIGDSSAHPPFAGTIDDVVLHDSSLSADRIAAHHQAGRFAFVGDTTERPPPLSPAEETLAVSVAENDELVATLVDGRDYDVLEVGAWKTERLPSRQLGSSVTLSWGTPVTIEADWPSVAYDSTEATWPPYRETLEHLTRVDVTGLEVWVDLGREEVVGIDPLYDEDDDPAEYEEPTGLLALAASQPRQGLRRIRKGNDRWWNYDFQPRGESRRHPATCCAYTQVDFPVTFLFTEDADIRRVQRGLCPDSLPVGSMCGGGDREWGRLTDGNGMIWRSSGGRKDPCGYPRYRNNHIRLYADPGNGRDPAPHRDDALYNLNWSFYVYGTTHMDIHHCGGGTEWFGRSERAERNIRRKVAEFRPDWNIRGNRVPLYNQDACETSGKWRRCSNGLATRVDVVWP